MNATPPRLAGLLALVLLAACDGDKAPNQAAPAKTAEATKTAPPTKAAEPTKAAPPAVAVDPVPAPVAPTPAVVESAPVAPTPAVVEPAVVEPAVVEPAAVEPAAVEPAVVEPAAVEPVAPPTPAVVASGAATPIALGPNAELLKLVLAHDVVNRQPVDPATTFASGTKVNLFIEARNESEAEQKIWVTWENVASGRRSPPVPVAIPVRKLNRTRAYRTLKLKGAHRCIVLGEGERELAALPFTIE